MFFVISALYFFFSGLYSVLNRKKALLSFFYGVAIIPTSTSFSSLNLKEGIFSYDFFVAGSLLSFFLSSRDRLMVCRGFMFALVVCCLGMVYVVFCVAVFSAELKFVLKDLRPFIFIFSISFLLYYYCLSNVFLGVPDKQVYLFVSLCCFSNLCWRYFLSYGNAADDVYYLENSYRYLDAGTYVAALFLLYCFVGRVSRKDFALYLTVGLSLLCLLIANSRFLVLAMLLGIFASNFDKFRRLVPTLFLSVLSCLLFVTFSFYAGATRVVDALSFDMLFGQLSVRFSPAIDKIASFEWYHYLVGEGVGSPFEIPWFAYREVLDVHNANIDSAFLTFYVKYGLLSVFPLFGLWPSIYEVVGKRVFLGISVLLSVIYFVSATHYQIYAIGVFLGVCVIYNLRRNSSSRL